MEKYIRKHLFMLSYTRQDLYSIATPMSLLEAGKEMVEVALKLAQVKPSEEEWVHVDSAQLPFEMLALEMGQAVGYKVGVVFGKEGQTEEEMFGNGFYSYFSIVSLFLVECFPKETTPEFEKFLEILGEKIEIKGWSGFRGGLSDENTAYHTMFDDYEILFMPTVLMNKDEQRQHIGNCKVMIYFMESGTPVPEFRGQQNYILDTFLLFFPHKFPTFSNFAFLDSFSYP